jgi:hypothetical protein
MQADKKCCIKLPSDYICMYKVYKKGEWILCLDLGPLPKILHYVYADIPKLKKTENIKHFLS